MLSPAAALSREFERAYQPALLPLLTPEEERAVATAALAGDAAARERLVRSNLLLVRWAARRWFANRKLPAADVLAAGALGLTIAAARFDPTRGTRFNTYAMPWVRQSIARATQDHGSASHVPAYLRADAGECMNRMGRGLSFEAACDAAGVPAARRECLRAATLAWEAVPLPGEPAGAYRDDPAAALAAGEDAARARRLLATLRGRQRQVIALRCGFDGPPRSCKEIGRLLGRSHGWVWRVEQQAIEAMRGVA